jgi:CO/xanthine dehydrogenase Mo-binding subunit
VQVIPTRAISAGESSSLRDVLRSVIAHDCGRVINPMVGEGQILGDFAQGLAGALWKRIAYDTDGQIQNASFMDFLIP